LKGEIRKGDDVQGNAKDTAVQFDVGGLIG